MRKFFFKVGHQNEEETDTKDAIVDSIKEKIEGTKNFNDAIDEKTSNGINNSDESEIDDYTIAEQSEKNVFFLHFYALSVKRFLVSFRQLKSSLLEIFIRMIFMFSGLILANIDFILIPAPFVLNMNNFPIKNDLYIGYTQNIPDFQNYIDTIDTEIFSVSTIATKQDPNIFNTLSEFEGIVFKDKGGYDKGIHNAGNNVIYDLKIDPNAARKCQVFGFSNGFTRDGAPIQMGNILNSCLKTLLGQKDFNLKFTNHPFPPTAAAKAGAKAGSGSIIAFLFAIAFSMIPTGVASYLVNERENNVKHQQMISGASMVSYWISNYVVDFIRSMIPMGFAIILVFAFNVDLPYIWVHFILFAMAIHPFTYATTFWFKKDNVAQIMTIILNIFLAGFLPIAVLVLQTIPSTRSAAMIIRWFPRIFPSYSVVSAIMQISIRNIIALVSGEDNPPAALSFEVAGGDALFLVIGIFFWWGVTIILEMKILERIFRRNEGVTDASRRTENIHIDSDVNAEEIRCGELNPQNCSVLVNQLRKVYHVNGEPLVAVRNI